MAPDFYGYQPFSILNFGNFSGYNIFNDSYYFWIVCSKWIKPYSRVTRDPRTFNAMAIASKHICFSVIWFKSTYEYTSLLVKYPPSKCLCGIHFIECRHQVKQNYTWCNTHQIYCKRQLQCNCMHHDHPHSHCKRHIMRPIYCDTVLHNIWGRLFNHSGTTCHARVTQAIKCIFAFVIYK